MDEWFTVVTRKGQITIPAPVRQALGLKQGDTVAVIVEDGQVRLVRVAGAVARTAGLLKAPSPSRPVHVLREAAEEAIAQETVARMGGGRA